MRRAVCVISIALFWVWCVSAEAAAKCSLKDPECHGNTPTKLGAQTLADDGKLPGELAYDEAEEIIDAAGEVLDKLLVTVNESEVAASGVQAHNERANQFASKARGTAIRFPAASVMSGIAKNAANVANLRASSAESKAKNAAAALKRAERELNASKAKLLAAAGESNDDQKLQKSKAAKRAGEAVLKVLESVDRQAEGAITAAGEARVAADQTASASHKADAIGSAEASKYLVESARQGVADLEAAIKGALDAVAVAEKRVTQLPSAAQPVAWAAISAAQKSTQAAQAKIPALHEKVSQGTAQASAAKAASKAAAEVDLKDVSATEAHAAEASAAAAKTAQLLEGLPQTVSDTTQEVTAATTALEKYQTISEGSRAGPSGIHMVLLLAAVTLATVMQ